MYKIKTLNKISEQGLEIFDDNYEVGDDLEHEDGILLDQLNYMTMISQLN